MYDVFCQKDFSAIFLLANKRVISTQGLAVFTKHFPRFRSSKTRFNRPFAALLRREHGFEIGTSLALKTRGLCLKFAKISAWLRFS
jgi:hypothetical protein